MNKRYRDIILKQVLFCGIREGELDAMLSCLDVRYLRFGKNELLLQAGEPFQKVGLVLEGSVQIINEDVWGNRAIQAQIGVGDIFGEAFACAYVKEVPISVAAVQESLVMFMDYKKIIHTCSSSCTFHHLLIENMMRLLARKNIYLIQKMQHLTMRSTRDKILSYLNACAVEAGSVCFQIPFNRQELADYLSVDRSAMSHELGKMQKEGILNFIKNDFELLKSNVEEE